MGTDIRKIGLAKQRMSASFHRPTGSATVWLLAAAAVLFMALAVWVNFFLIDDEPVASAFRERVEIDARVTPDGVQSITRDVPAASLLRQGVPNRSENRSLSSQSASGQVSAPPPTNPFSGARSSESLGFGASGRSNPFVSNSGQPVSQSFESASRITQAAGSRRLDTQRAGGEDSNAVESRAAEKLGENVEVETDSQRDDGSERDLDLNKNLAISGQVLNEAGVPLAGVKLTITVVRLFDVGEGVTLAASERQRSTVSGPDGFYIVQGLADGEYSIRADAMAGYQPGHAMVRAGVDFADLVLMSQRAGQVRGVVTSVFGVPLAGVRVTPLVAWAKSTQSDSEGRYVIDLNVKDKIQSFTIRFQHADYHQQEQRLNLAPGRNAANAVLNVTLEPIELSAAVSGLVLSTAGSPVVGEQVQLHSSKTKKNYRAATDQEGRYVIPGVIVGEDYRLWIHARGAYKDYVAERLQVPAEGLRKDITLEALEQANRLSGQMRDAFGNPVPDFTLTLHSKSAVRKKIQVTGDGQGYYVVDNAPEGELILQTHSMPRFTVSGINMPPGGVEEVALILDWGHYALRGVVVDSQGNAVSAPRITLAWSHAESSVRSQSSRGTASDAQGFFSFSQLGPGLHTVTVQAPGFKTKRVEVDVGDLAEELVVRLEE